MLNDPEMLRAFANEMERRGAGNGRTFLQSVLDALDSFIEKLASLKEGPVSRYMQDEFARKRAQVASLLADFSERYRDAQPGEEQTEDARFLLAASHSLDALSAIANGADFGLLHNDRFGEIQYPLGRLGKDNGKGKRKGGMGFLHIVQERMLKDRATLDEAIEIALKVGIAAELGVESRSVMNTHWLDYD